MDSTPPPANGQNPAPPAFSGGAPMMNPFSSQNTIPSSANGDIVVSSDGTKSKKGLIIALVAIGVLVIGAIIAALILASQSSQKGNLAESTDASANNSNEADDRQKATALYRRMDGFLEEYLWNYIQAPELSDAFIDLEIASAADVHDEDAANLVSSIAQYYQINAKRVKILNDNNCIVGSKINESCVTAIKEDPNSEAGISDIDSYLESIHKEIKTFYEKINLGLTSTNREQNSEK